MPRVFHFLLPTVGRDRRAHAGEPWGRKLWLAFATIMLIAFGLQAYGINKWPMADDEVPSLVELGVLHIGAEKFFSVPADQIPKLPKATIVWNTFQRTALRFLPDGEISYRIPGLICGLLTSALAFLFAARWRGLWYAAALSLLINASQIFVYLVQLDRFYSLPLLLLTLALAAIAAPSEGWWLILATALLTVLTVLSHNITVVVFVLAFLAACPLYLIGRVSSGRVVRSGVAAAISVLLYFFYLLPLVRGWSSTGNPTQVLVSFSAHAGIPVLALAMLGSWLAIVRPDRDESMLWWVLMFVGSLAVVQVTSMSWNPRYFLFFMPAVWILGAHGMEFVADMVGRRSLGIAWYGCVAVLLAPGLLSHYQDGSRHDYRQAAAVLIADDTLDQPILSDDAETISYYLPANLRARLDVRTRVRVLPASGFFMVCRSNAWMPLLQIPNRKMDLRAEIYRRRFDQFSHILRVYHVEAAGD